jgi:hypothetical protein
MATVHTTDGGVHEGRREVKWSIALLVATVALAFTGARSGRPSGILVVDFVAWLGGVFAMVYGTLALVRRRRALRREWGAPAGSLLRNLTCALAGAAALTAIFA